MKFLRDTWLIFARALITTLRTPVWVVVGLFQPVCFLLLFGPLLEGVAKAPGFPPGGAFNVFTPGLLVQLALFSAAFVGFGLIADLRAGVIEQMRVTPVHRLALLLGRSLRDMLVLLVQGLVLRLAAWPMGLRADFLGILISLALVCLMALMLSAFSYALALALRSEDALAPVINFLTVPLLLLSGITLPLSLAPDWIKNVARFNPFSYVVDATRSLFNGNYGDSAVIWAFLIMGALTLLTTWWAGSSIREAAA